MGFLKRKMNKHSKMISLVVCLLALLGISQAEAQTLVLHHTDGTTTDVELYTQPNVRFVKDKVLVTSSVANLEYDEKDIIRFTYKGKNTGITSPSIDSDYSREEGCVVFHNIKSTDNISLYNTNGIRIPVRLTVQGSTAILPLSSVPSGMYLLNINGRTSKFTKK